MQPPNSTTSPTTKQSQFSSLSPPRNPNPSNYIPFALTKTPMLAIPMF